MLKIQYCSLDNNNYKKKQQANQYLQTNNKSSYSIHNRNFFFETIADFSEI